MTLIIKRCLLTICFLLSTNTLHAESVEYCENLGAKLHQYGDSETVYQDLALQARRKAVETIFAKELESYQPDYFTKGEMIDSILNLIEFDADIQKKNNDDKDAFNVCITLKNVHTTLPNDHERFQAKKIAEICHAEEAFVDEKIAEINDRFIDNLKTGNLSEPMKLMLNEPENIKLQNHEQIDRFTHVRNFKSPDTFLPDLFCKELYLHPIDLYISSSPREISSTISLLPPVDARDEEGKKAEFQVVVIHRDYSWKKSSIDVVEKDGKKVEGFSTRFQNPRFIELSQRHLRDLVSLGMASCEGDVDRETKRAEERTLSVLGWLNAAFTEADDIDIYGINLGKHKLKGKACEKTSDELRSSQRALILIGVVRGSDPDVDLKQAINNALKSIAKEQPEKLPINPKDYLQFEILDQNGSFTSEIPAKEDETEPKAEPTSSSEDKAEVDGNKE